MTRHEEKKKTNDYSVYELRQKKNEKNKFTFHFLPLTYLFYVSRCGAFFFLMIQKIKCKICVQKKRRKKKINKSLGRKLK